VKEIKIKLIIYNIDKKSCRGNWHQIEDFYRARKLTSYICTRSGVIFLSESTP
jgi:hypothetical protein